MERSSSLLRPRESIAKDVAGCLDTRVVVASPQVRGGRRLDATKHARSTVPSMCEHRTAAGA